MASRSLLHSRNVSKDAGFAYWIGVGVNLSKPASTTVNLVELVKKTAHPEE